ncbi:1-acylglycerol-3-phosphate O-acyltransferase [Nowakowskiella sp. JEL0407]|nr:1-acylglycerol-3-phosphate O-acyltransferase [Nowakowskiella sp. JEL0407]
MSLLVHAALWPSLAVGSSALGYITNGLLQFVARAFCLAILTAIGSTFGILTGIILYPLGLGYHVNIYTGRFYAMLVSKFLGIEYRIEGWEHLDSRRPCVFVANHQSSLDVASIGSCFPKNTVIMAKKSLFWVPFLGLYIYLAKNIFINRSNRSSALNTMEIVAQLLVKYNIALWMFPEGTRSRQTDNSMLPFKKGAFHLAIAGKMPIVPVVFSTYGNVYSTKAKRFEGGVIRVKGMSGTLTVLPPIETETVTMGEIEDLIEKTRSVMVETLNEISPPPQTKKQH